MSQTMPDDDERDWLDHTFAYVKQRPYVWVPMVLVIVVLAGFVFQKVYTTAPIGTDPTVANRPLSNQDQHLHTLAIDPTQPGHILLGSHYGLFTSADNGKTWPQKRGQLNTLMITSIATDPAVPGTDALIGIEPNGGNFGQNGIYFTHDDTKTWTRANDPAGVATDTDRFLIVSGLATVHSWLAIYVGVGLFATDDDGHTWRLLRAPTSPQEAQRALWVSPTHPNEILLGTNQGLVISQDDGAHWAAAAGIAAGNGTYAISASNADANTIYVSTDAGIFRSQDGGTTFAMVSPQVASGPFSRLASSAQHVNILYGLVDQSVWSSPDGGVTWTQQQVLQSSQPMALLVAPDNDQHIYVGFYSPAIASESLDGGKTWNLIAS